MVFEIEQDGNGQVASKGEEEDGAPFANYAARRGTSVVGRDGGSSLERWTAGVLGRGSSTRTSRPLSQS